MAQITLNSSGVASNGTLALQSNGTTTAVTIDASQRVGLGNSSTSPTSLLYLRDTGNIQFVISKASVGSFDIFNKGTTGTEVGTTDPYPLIFKTNDTEKARIDSSGNLLVGTTSATCGGVDMKTHISATDFCLGITTAASSSTQAVRFAYGTTAVGSITLTGSTTSYNVSSDQRLKENIVDAPEFGSVIDSIQVRSYDWKSNGSHQRAGFIAQELVTVASEAVHQPTDTDEMMAVDYSKLVPMLVKEIQSLRKRLADAGIA
jgi:hypothetical protein